MSNELTIIQSGDHDSALDHPVYRYMAELNSKRSRDTMMHGLHIIARMLTDGQCDAITLGKGWAALRRPVVLKLKTELAEKYKPATTNRMMTGVRQVLKECWRMGLIPVEDYQQAVDFKPLPNHTLPAGREIAHDEIAALLESCYNDPHPAGVRDAAIIAVLWSGGLRRAELTALQLSDYLRDKGSVQVLHGKGDKQRIVPLSRSAVAVINAWIEKRGDAPGPLWYKFTRTGQMLHEMITSQGIYDMLKRRGDRAGVADFSTHDMRRTCVSDYLAIGVDIAIVSKLMGHADISTTARYDRRNEDAKQEAANLRDLPRRE